ncbi:MAG: hypothetical protein KDD25_08840, partial [Bdellovibrionales bacterium]|nr:hypothetical protein [Bdellovibrionales bacterium]
MRSFIRVLLIGISIIFTYQNCSLYQNEGRKFLDSVSDGANNPNPPAPTGRTISNLCVPYVV